MLQRCGDTPKRDQPKTGELMSSTLLPLAGFEKVLRYDADTGLLYWIVAIYRIKKPGDLAGHLNNHGYIEVRYNRTTYQGHRIAWYLHTGTDPGTMSIDHIDGNRSNNCISNLRLATAAQNAQNSKKPISAKTSKYKGVSWYPRLAKWQANIRINGKSIYLGYFYTEEEAFLAYCRAAEQHYGEFARYE